MWSHQRAKPNIRVGNAKKIQVVCYYAWLKATLRVCWMVSTFFPYLEASGCWLW